MRKIHLVAVIILLALAGCKKSKTADSGMSPTNTEVTITSAGTFSIKLIQTSPSLSVRYTEVGTHVSNYDKKLLLKSGDNLQVQITDATADAHLVVTYNGKTIGNATDSPTLNYSTGF